MGGIINVGRASNLTASGFSKDMKTQDLDISNTLELFKGKGNEVDPHSVAPIVISILDLIGIPKADQERYFKYVSERCITQIEKEVTDGK